MRLGERRASRREACADPRSKCIAGEVETAALRVLRARPKRRAAIARPRQSPRERTKEGLESFVYWIASVPGLPRYVRVLICPNTCAMI